MYIHSTPEGNGKPIIVVLVFFPLNGMYRIRCLSKFSQKTIIIIRQPTAMVVINKQPTAMVVINRQPTAMVVNSTRDSISLAKRGITHHQIWGVNVQ